MNAELGHEAFDHAKEADISEVAVLGQILKAVHAIGRPLAGNLQHEIAFGGLERGLEVIRCRFGQLIGLHQCLLVGEYGLCGHT